MCRRLFTQTSQAECLQGLKVTPAGLSRQMLHTSSPSFSSISFTSLANAALAPQAPAGATGRATAGRSLGITITRAGVMKLLN